MSLTARIWRVFLNGLVVVVPVVVTVALLQWLGTTFEQLIGALLRPLIPEGAWFPGLGVLLGVTAIFLVGLATRVWLTRQLIGLGSRLIERIPLANSIYSGARDLMKFVSEAGQPSDLDKVVLVEVRDGVRLVGFITEEDPTSVLPAKQLEDHVAIYLQMSYQMGGYTILVPRDRVQALDMDLEDAMRWLLTAGMSTGAAEEQSTEGPSRD